MGSGMGRKYHGATLQIQSRHYIVIDLWYYDPKSLADSAKESEVKLNYHDNSQALEKKLYEMMVV